ncbi:MAG: O-antigen ligase family protein [Planctomycetota bacterium]
MLENLRTIDPIVLVFGATLALFAALALRLACKSNYGFMLLATLLVLTAAATRFTPLRALTKGVLRWPALIAMAGIGVLPVRRTATSWRHKGVLLGVAGFVAVSFLSCSYSIWPLYSFQKAGSVAILMVAAYVGVYQRAAHKEKLWEFAEVLYRLALLIGGLSALLIMAPVGGRASSRFAGFFLNPNGLGLFCSMLLPVAIWRHYEMRRLRKTSRHIALALVFVLAALVFLSGSRGAFISGFLASAFVLFVLYGSRALLPVAAIIVIGVLGVVGNQLLQSFVLQKTEHLIRAERLATLTHRTELWRRAWPYVKAKPILGSGFGVSRYIFYDPQIEAGTFDPSDTYYTTLHSMHIQVAVDLGIVGVFFLWALLAYIGYLGIRILLERDRSPERALAAGLLGGCIVVAMDTVIHGWLDSAGSQGAFLFHVMFACLLQATAQWREERRLTREAEDAGSAAAGEAASAAGEAPGEGAYAQP